MPVQAFFLAELTKSDRTLGWRLGALCLFTHCVFVTCMILFHPCKHTVNWGCCSHCTDGQRHGRSEHHSLKVRQLVSSGALTLAFSFWVLIFPLTHSFIHHRLPASSGLSPSTAYNEAWLLVGGSSWGGSDGTGLRKGPTAAALDSTRLGVQFEHWTQ